MFKGAFLALQWYICISFTAFFLTPNAFAATYNSFQDLIDNEEIIFGYGFEAAEGFSVSPSFILEKDGGGNWLVSTDIVYSLSPQQAVTFQFNNASLVQTYAGETTSVTYPYIYLYDAEFAEKWGASVASQLIDAYYQGLITSSALQMQVDIATTQVTMTMTSSSDNEMIVDIDSQITERLNIPQNVIDNLAGGWQGSTTPEYSYTDSQEGVRLSFGFSALAVPEWTDNFVSLPLVANYTDYSGNTVDGYVHDLFWHQGSSSSSISTVLGEAYTLLKDTSELTLSIAGNTFNYHLLEQINGSTWTVLVDARMADLTEYTFVDELVLMDGSASEFDDNLVSTFPFAQMAQINGRWTESYDERGLVLCDYLFGYVFHEDQTLNRGVGCSNDLITYPDSIWQWELTETGVEMSTSTSYFESRVRTWIPLQTDQHGRTWVLEYSSAKLVGNNFSGFFIAPRINYIELVNLSDYTTEYQNSGYDGDNDGDGYADSEDDDDDNDGMPDEYEAANGLNHLDGNDAAFDKDGDGLTNYSEFEQGTSPVKADTDGDGVIDSVDGYPLDALRTDSTAELFSFSYTFDANTRGTTGHVLEGIVEGFLMEDGDTIVISKFVSASLGGHDYEVTASAAVRAADPSDTPKMSLSGDELDFWVCVQGFTYTYDNGGGDCAFGPEGGFLISYYVDSNTGDCLDTSGGDCSVWAWAGIPELGDSYRDGDIPVNRNNWSATTYSTSRIRNDVDGDGKSDLLWRSYTKGWNFLWIMDGTATATTIPINVVPGTAWDMVGQGDYDADGKSDIFWRNNATGQNFIYLMEGAVYKSRYTLNYVGATDWRVAGSGDFDGDGTGDVLWRNINRGDTWFYLMDAGLIRDSLPSLAVNDLNYEIAATGDVDGDGDDDVIWRNSASGINYIWLMQGGSIASRYTLNTVNTEWDIAGAGDLDGDGTDDIILRNQVSGENWVYFMENGQIRESTLINTVADTNWQIANMGDYDGDGKVDFLWRHAADARNIIHLMDGTTRKASGVLKNTDDTWKLAR